MIVIYFDTLFSSTINLRKISETLATQAEELARMGTVEIVVGDMTSTLVLPATRDVEAIRRGFKEAVSRGAKDFLTVHRRRFIRDQDDRSSTPRRNTTLTATQRAVDPEARDIVQPMIRLDQVGLHHGRRSRWPSGSGGTCWNGCPAIPSSGPAR